MDADDRPLLADEDSVSDPESSLSDLAFDNFSNALVGSAATPQNPQDSASVDTRNQYDSIEVSLSTARGREFGQDDNRTSASAQWHGRTVATGMAFLMMLSSAQLVVGFMFMLAYVGIPPMVTALLGLLVSFGHMMGYIPGDHLEKQVRLVNTVSTVALGINAPSLTLYTVILIAALAAIDGWQIEVDLTVIYAIFWLQTLLFAWVGMQSSAVLRMLHPETS